MGLSVVKGQKVDLAKATDAPKFAIGLGWDAPPPGSTGHEYDLDVSVFGLDASGALLGEKWVVYYNQKASGDGAIQHSGDNLTGAGDGDDETIIVDTAKLDPRCTEVNVIVTIYDAAARGGQTFGKVKNSKARVYDANSGTELMVYELEEETETQLATAVQFGSLYLKNGQWKWNAIGAGFKDKGLVDFMKLYGVA